MRTITALMPGVGSEMPEIREDRYQRVFRDFTQAVEGELELPVLDAEGNVQEGNSKMWPVRVSFDVADKDTAVHHGRGRVITMWSANMLNKAAIVYQPSDALRPTEATIYLRCDTADTEATILVWWQE